MSAARSGRFIVLEGGEGAGKSSVLQALAARLNERGRTMTVTREPGGTPLGERIRALLLDGGPSPDAMTELLLFEAARAQLVASVIRPALERGNIVLCDRFCASSTAYQGYGRGLGRELVERANAIATGGLVPDLTLLLDLPVADGLARRAGDGGMNRIDRADMEFHERVRAGFLELAAAGGDAWRVIDASRPLDAVVEDAWGAVAAKI